MTCQEFIDCCTANGCNIHMGYATTWAGLDMLKIFLAEYIDDYVIIYNVSDSNTYSHDISVEEFNEFLQAVIETFKTYYNNKYIENIKSALSNLD